MDFFVSLIKALALFAFLLFCFEFLGQMAWYIQKVVTLQRKNWKPWKSVFFIMIIRNRITKRCHRHQTKVACHFNGWEEDASYCCLYLPAIEMAGYLCLAPLGRLWWYLFADSHFFIWWQLLLQYRLAAKKKKNLTKNEIRHTLKCQEQLLLVHS